MAASCSLNWVKNASRVSSLGSWGSSLRSSWSAGSASAATTKLRPGSCKRPSTSSLPGGIEGKYLGSYFSRWWWWWWWSEHEGRRGNENSHTKKCYKRQKVEGMSGCMRLKSAHAVNGTVLMITQHIIRTMVVVVMMMVCNCFFEWRRG